MDTDLFLLNCAANHETAWRGSTECEQTLEKPEVLLGAGRHSHRASFDSCSPLSLPASVSYLTMWFSKFPVTTRHPCRGMLTDKKECLTSSSWTSVQAWWLQPPLPASAETMHHSGDFKSKVAVVTHKIYFVYICSVAPLFCCILFWDGFLYVAQPTTCDLLP